MQRNETNIHKTRATEYPSSRDRANEGNTIASLETRRARIAVRTTFIFLVYVLEIPFEILVAADDGFTLARGRRLFP